MVGICSLLLQSAALSTRTEKNGALRTSFSTCSRSMSPQQAVRSFCFRGDLYVDVYPVWRDGAIWKSCYTVLSPAECRKWRRAKILPGFTVGLVPEEGFQSSPMCPRNGMFWWPQNSMHERVPCSLQKACLPWSALIPGRRACLQFAQIQCS